MSALFGDQAALPVFEETPKIPLTMPIADFGPGPMPVDPIPFNGSMSNRILAALPGADLSRLLPFLESVSLNVQQQLNRYGENVDYVYFPETAVISHVYFLADGSTASSSVVGNEGAVGLSAIFEGAPSWRWIEVTLPGSAFRAPIAAVKKEFHDGGALHHLLLSCMSKRLTQVSQRAVCNSCHELPQRLCTWLLMIHDRARTQQLSLTQEMMAKHLGTRRASVNAACTTLRENGVIDYRRGAVTILNRKKLEAVACECHRA